MFPQFLSFLIAFFILASLWIVHHEHFHFLRSVNKVVLWLNVLILIFVVLVPFSTNLSGTYSHVPIAPLIFHANMLVLSCLFLVQWAVHHPPPVTAHRANPSRPDTGCRYGPGPHHPCCGRRDGTCHIQRTLLLHVHVA